MRVCECCGEGSSFGNRLQILSIWFKRNSRKKKKKTILMIPDRKISVHQPWFWQPWQLRMWKGIMQEMHKINTSPIRCVAQRERESCKQMKGRGRGRREMALLVIKGVCMCMSVFGDVIIALPALWLCAPGGWADPPRRPARGAGNTGGLCLLRVGAGWPPSGVCRNPGGGREDRGGKG